MTIELTEQRDLLIRVLTDLKREFTAQSDSNARLAAESQSHKLEWQLAANTWKWAAAMVDDRLEQEQEPQQ